MRIIDKKIDEAIKKLKIDCYNIEVRNDLDLDQKDILQTELIIKARNQIKETRWESLGWYSKAGYNSFIQTRNKIAANYDEELLKYALYKSKNIVNTGKILLTFSSIMVAISLFAFGKGSNMTIAFVGVIIYCIALVICFFFLLHHEDKKDLYSEALKYKQEHPEWVLKDFEKRK